jgi:hypothetical protein
LIINLSLVFPASANEQVYILVCILKAPDFQFCDPESLVIALLLILVRPAVLRGAPDQVLTDPDPREVSKKIFSNTRKKEKNYSAPILKPDRLHWQ